MKLGFGLGFSNKGNTFPRPFVVPNTPRGTLFYDSIGNQFRAQTNVAGGFNDDMKVYFDPTTAGGLQDMSTDGCALLKSTEDAAGGVTWMIDDVTNPAYADWSPSAAQYNTVYDAMSTAANTSDYAIFVSGTNDASVGSNITKANYKLAMQKMKQFIQSNARNFPNIQCAFVMPLHRSDSGASSNTNYNTVRQAQRELCTEDTWFKILPDTYDLDLVDTAHFTTLVYQTTFASRFADAIAYVFGKRAITGVYGPKISGVTFYGGYADFTVLPDAGTDISVTSGCQNTLAIIAGSTNYKFTSVTRTDATTFRAQLDDQPLNNSAIGNIVIADGCMSELSQTSAEVIKDNAASPKPLQSQVITPTIAHPLFNVTNGDLHFMAKTATKTYSSGALVSSAVDRCGKTWTAAAGDEGTYDGTAFGGKGGLVSSDVNRYFASPNASWTAGSSLWLIVVFEVPAATNTNSYLMSIETSNSASLIFNASGQMSYLTTTAAYTSGDLRNTRNFVMLNYTSLSTLDIYLNSSTPVYSGDPNDTFSGLDRINFFNRTSATTAGNTDMKIAEVFARDSAWVSGVDPSIASILAFYQSYYGTQ